MSDRKRRAGGSTIEMDDARATGDRDGVARQYQLEELAVHDPDPEGRIKAIEELMALTATEGHVQGLTEYMEGDSSPEVREWCFDQLKLRNAETSLWNTLTTMTGESYDFETRAWAARELGNQALGHIAPADSLHDLYFALASTSWNPSITEPLVEALKSRWAPAKKLAAMVDVLVSSEAATPYVVDFRAMVDSLALRTRDDRIRAARYIVAKARETRDHRVTSLLAWLLVSLGGTRSEAASLVQVAVSDDNVPEPDIRPLRIEIGGEAALRPILDAVQNDFSKPLNQLFQKTMSDWRTLTTDAQRGFKARLIMSVTVFVVGLLLTVVSFFVVVFGNQGERILGPGVTLAAGLGSMLAVVYRGPLRDLRAAVADLADTNVGFMGFMHQLQFTAALVRTEYAQGRLDPEKVETTGRILEAAAGEWVTVSRAKRPDNS
jgi:hypothetical protein